MDAMTQMFMAMTERQDRLELARETAHREERERQEATLRQERERQDRLELAREATRKEEREWQDRLELSRETARQEDQGSGRIA